MQNNNYDVIIISAVFEHLPNPLAEAKHLYQQLKPEGLLIFDYVNSQGQGLDTREAVEQRSAVLSFIKDNFQIIQGEIYSDERDIGMTVAKKTKNINNIGI